MATNIFKSVMIGAVITLPLIGTALAVSGRFIMEKTNEGYIRMDTQTGAMSICEAEKGQIVCKMAADERAAFDGDIKALEERIATLEQRLESGSNLFSHNGNGLPSEEEFERGMGYMEEFMRRFMGIAKERDEEESRT